MKNIKNILLFISFITLCTLLFSASHTESKDTYAFISPKLNFCGEKLPLQDPEVYERMDRELITNINYHTSTTLIIKRANKIFPIIEPILKKNNIPDDFKYICVIESGLTNVTSPAGAKGYWQLMPTTAKELGLEVSSQVDERNHLEKSTQAACDYINQAYKKFGNWTLVAAAYNRGMSGISSDLNTQGVDSYYVLYLNNETARYVFRAIALKEIMENPLKYGYDIPKSLLYKQPETKSILISSSIPDLYVWAKEQGISFKTLKYHNPWIIDTKLSASESNPYIISLPK